MEETKEFLNTVFGRKLERSKMVLFYLPGRWSVGFTSIDPLVEAAKKEDNGGNDVYIHVCTTGKTIPKRPSAEDVDCMYAVWLDLDTQLSKDSKALPEDKESLIEWLKTMQPHPTITVDSGNGLHAWWVLEKPLLIDDDESRNRAASLADRWQRAIIGRAYKEKKWKFDSTMDLARILRLPGCHNYKGGGKLPVTICREMPSGKPCTVDQIETVINNNPIPNVLDSMHRQDAAKGIGPGFSRDPRDIEVGDANTVLEEVGQLLKKDGDPEQEWPTARSLLLGVKPSIFTSDSLSDFDFAMAKILLRAKATDELLFRALYTMRRAFHSFDPAKYESGPDKLLRVKYLENTKIRAIAGLNQVRGDAEVPEIVCPEDISDEERKQARLTLSGVLKCKLDAIIQVGLVPPRWDFVVNGKRVTIGPLEHVKSAAKLSTAIEDVTLMPTGLTAAEWRRCRDLIFRAVIHEEPPPEMTDAYISNIKLTEYVYSGQWVKEYNVAIRDSEPVFKKGHWYVNSEAFLAWLNSQNLYKMREIKSLIDIFKTAGFVSRLLHYYKIVRDGKGVGGRSTQRYWRTNLTNPVLPDGGDDNEGV